MTQWKASLRTVQNYVLVGKSKRIPLQRRGTERTKRKAEAREHCKYQGHVKISSLDNNNPVVFASCPFWSRRDESRGHMKCSALFFSRTLAVSGTLTDLRPCLMPIEPCFNTCGCSQFLIHLAHETKWNKNMSWEWECKCDFMALWLRRHSIYSYRLERRGCQWNENKNNLRSFCSYFSPPSNMGFHISYAKSCLVITADRSCGWKIYSVFLGFIHPCNLENSSGFVFPIENITRFKNFLSEIMLSPFIIVLNMSLFSHI